MPLIRVEMFEGRSTDQKRELVEALTRETARVCKCSPESVIILIQDVKKSDWGVGGQLCSERYPE